MPKPLWRCQKIVRLKRRGEEWEIHLEQESKEMVDYLGGKGRREIGMSSMTPKSPD